MQRLHHRKCLGIILFGHRKSYMGFERCLHLSSWCPGPLGELFECLVGLFYLRLGLFCLRLVFVAYGNLVWSFLLTVENRFGLFYLRFPPSGNWFGLFCLRFPPRPEIGFGLFYLRFPHRK